MFEDGRESMKKGTGSLLRKNPFLLMIVEIGMLMVLRRKRLMIGQLEQKLARS
jgi:hypothetical protein